MDQFLYDSTMFSTSRRCLSAFFLYKSWSVFGEIHQKVVVKKVLQSGQLEQIALMTVLRGRLTLDYTLAAPSLPTTPSVYVSEISMSLLHRRLGHSGQPAIHRLLNENMATSVKRIKGSSISPCDDRHLPPSGAILCTDTTPPRHCGLPHSKTGSSLTSPTPPQDSATCHVLTGSLLLTGWQEACFPIGAELCPGGPPMLPHTCLYGGGHSGDAPQIHTQPKDGEC